MGRRRRTVLYRFNRLKVLLMVCLITLFSIVIGSTPPLQLHAEETFTLPSAQAHPLPPSLAKWQESNGQGDYFDQVKAVKVGVLVWKTFPIKVFIAPPPPGTLMKTDQWNSAIAQAIQEWQPYLPLTIIKDATNADIQISGQSPKYKSGQRIRSAETSFDLYLNNRQELSHRMTIYLRPNQTARYLSAAARHEMGHALGIWGHSPNPTDVMYFSQVRTPPSISSRDLNTLKQIYKQPTHLGWPVLKPQPQSIIEKQKNRPRI